METKDKRGMDRRKFLKVLGTGAAISTVALAGCDPKNNRAAGSRSTTDIPTDAMTYRTNSKTGEKVSLLGYGCMRWPTVSGCLLYTSPSPRD